MFTMKKTAAIIIVILFLIPFFHHSFRFFKEYIDSRKEVASGKQQFTKVMQVATEKNKPREQKYESKVQDEILYYRLNSKEHVKQVQKALKKAGFYKEEVDGKMGPRTKLAIKAFQKVKKINPDGIVGPKTWEMLERTLRTND